MSKVVLADSCFCSPIGNSSNEAVESLKKGRSGIVGLGPAFGETAPVGALSSPGPDDTDTRQLHPRLSSRYTMILNGFCARLKRMLAPQPAIDEIFLICRLPYYSNWRETSTDTFDDLLFVSRILERGGLEIHPRNIHWIESACSSGLVALNLAIRKIERHPQRRILLLGLEAELNPEGLVALRKLGALSPGRDPRRACQPFSVARSGLVVGEVAVAALLTSHRRGREEIFLRTGGTTADAFRTTDGLESGEYLTQCLSQAMHTLSVDDIDFVCPHATSTPMNDRIEGAVLERYFASRLDPLWVAPLKQYVGHTLDSSGLWETVLAAELLRHNFLPPLLAVDPVEPHPRLRFASQCTHLPLTRAIKLSIGFGGINSSILLEKGA